MPGSEHAVKAVVCVADAERRATLAQALRPAAAVELLGAFAANGDARPLLEQGAAELWLVDGETLRGELGAALLAGDRRDDLRLVHVAAADGAPPPAAVSRRLDVTGLWSQAPGAAALVRARINSLVAEARRARRRAANEPSEPDEAARPEPPRPLPRERAASTRAANAAPASDDPDAHALAGIAATPIDGVALIGSSGTPALLPHLLARVQVRAWPFVVAVHHNPAFADSFREWVGELLQAPARPLEALGSPRRAVGPWVVPAWASNRSDAPAVSPDLDRVLERLHACGGRWVIVIGSGMGTLRAAALQPFAGAIVGLEPSCNPQPSMVLDAYRQGLIRAWVGVHSLARWLRTHGQHPPLAAAD